MRIAISGSHRAGKSTLAEELVSRLPGHGLVAEPYEQMVEEGYGFLQPPSREDFEAQLDRSLELFEDPDANLVFDRCPLDFVAYLSIHGDPGATTFEERLPRVRRALETLDLLVFVPIEPRDRIVLTSSEEEDDSREAADERLRELLHEDLLPTEVAWLEVMGSPQARAESVLKFVRGRR